MRTRVYIDGYNLYYGCLKGTSYKWLNLVKLFQTYIIPRTPTFNSPLCEDIEIKYFTAPIDAKAASDVSSVNDQRSYVKAWRWLSKLSEKPPVEGLPDVSGDLGCLLDSEQGLKDIMEHVQAYVANNVVG